MRTWNEFGAPIFVGDLTPEEEEELWDYGLSGVLPFAPLPDGADRTNVKPFPFAATKANQDPGWLGRDCA